MDLKNKKVTVLGLGRSGTALAELIDSLKGIPRISEKAPYDSVKKVLENWPLKDRVETEFGNHSREFIEKSDLVVLSPGVRIDAPPVQWAREKNIPVIGEIELAWSFCDKPVIAVTGSNGKTTVSTLIKEFLAAAGKKVCLCGNIGSPFSKHVLELKDKDFVVLEISSFQLESIVHFRPHVAVFINFSQNHLDRHKDLQEYLDAKKRIFMNQAKGDYAVLNYQDPTVKGLTPELKAKVIYFNSPQVLEHVPISNPNYLAASAAAGVLGVSQEICRKAFENFKGVEHRLEQVRTIEGVDFINDSKSTTIESGRWALESIERPIILICGGRDKKLDFSVIKDLVRNKVKLMIIIGEAREKIRQVFKGVIPIEESDSFKNAVLLARQKAVKGDCVILSPMCTSYDMFSNFEERGKVFKEIVNGI
ncbi:MAG TPA: UDP-N-acetylmuramoyl-L-alanine--D-glutamate ligase [Candidatus Omnitrophota bacterium]|nr:UDP-N-acetylmuramoyl-L-alanine--D-glutamate ligase [Candidatus Omnitrophota bacterium]HPD85102.1 UDP-N-acetylmuramoyl-L-alanine--D-glutamate ligase [Candidatus Omnitrophota bacterium]HRZ03960.1 UDP-N-acetylmuramoyl-L-alanine--D-glutamate ligase [Candidatus Omnitrophota bacterium]